jgi:hypothetical protein
MTLPSEPWRVQVDKIGDPDEPFIQRTIVGQNLGGGVEVAIVTTGSYTDQVEAQHAYLLAAAPLLLATLRKARAFIQLDRTGYADAHARPDGTLSESDQPGLDDYDAQLRAIDAAIALATTVPPA